eukprot:gene4932-8529_t
MSENSEVEETILNGKEQTEEESIKETLNETKNKEKENEIKKLFLDFEEKFQFFEKECETKFNEKFKEEKIKKMENNFEKIKEYFLKKENKEDDLKEELKEEIEKNKLLIETNKLLTDQNVSGLTNQFDSSSNIKLENQLESVIKEFEEYKEKKEKEFEDKTKEHDALKKKMKDWKDKVKEITSKDAKKIETLKKLVVEKDELILNFDKLTSNSKYTILEHVKYQEENWCLIQYENNEKKYWVDNIPVNDLPDSLQDALEEEYHQEIEKFQLENQKLKKDFQEKEDELSKYKTRAHAALKKKTDELNEEKSSNDSIRIELENSNEKLKKEIENLKEKNDNLLNQVDSLLEYQTKTIDLSNEIDQLNEKNNKSIEEFDLLKEEKDIEINNLNHKIDSLTQNFENEIENLKKEKIEIEEESKRNIKNSTEKNRKILQQYERENSRLQKSLSEKEELLLNSIQKNEKEVKEEIKVDEKIETDENEKFIRMAQMQANRDQELFGLQQKIQQLEAEMKMNSNITIQLQEEQKKNERFEKRENANLEYLKNILVKFLSTPDVKVQKNLLPAISTVLAFSEDEKNEIEQKFISLTNSSSSYWSPISQIFNK